MFEACENEGENARAVCRLQHMSRLSTEVNIKNLPVCSRTIFSIVELNSCGIILSNLRVSLLDRGRKAVYEERGFLAGFCSFAWRCFTPFQLLHNASPRNTRQKQNFI